MGDFRNEVEKQDVFLDKYITLISQTLEDEFFLLDYNKTYPIDVQFQTILDFYPTLYPCTWFEWILRFWDKYN